MASLDEAFQNVKEENKKYTDRSFSSLMKEREIEIKPFTPKENELNGNIFLDKTTTINAKKNE